MSMDCTRQSLPLLESVAACVLSDELRFGSRIFSTIIRTNPVDGTEGFAVAVAFEERADIRQFAARPAINALTFASLGDRQYRRKGPFGSGNPGIPVFVCHSPVFPR
jgi:hypothetical protein